MSRPRKQDNSLIISANGMGAVWNPEIGFVGDKQLVVRAQSAALWGLSVQPHPLLAPIIASDSSALGAYAALSWAAGGRDVLVGVPTEVMEYFGDAPEDDEIDEIPAGQIETNSATELEN